MRKRCSLFLIILLSCNALAGQTGSSQVTTPPQPQTSQTATPPQNSDTSNFTSAKGFVLEDGIPVKLRLNRNVSSADAQVGDGVDFEVLEEVSINGVTVIPKGGLARGTVTEAQAKRRMARGGKLDMNVDSVRLVDGEKAALRAVKEAKGGGHTGAMTAGIVVTGLLVWPAAPFFLFMHGKDVTVPKGAEITAYINGDMKLDIAKFEPAAPAQNLNAANNNDQNASAPSAKLQIDSTPPGADIEVDGSFVGNTPSEVQVAEGDHAVVVKKAGFKSWERKLKSSAGSSVHINAELEKADAP
jgi:PEGA domain